MHKGWLALTVCTGLFAGCLTWGTTQPTQAATIMKGGEQRMSLVEPAKAKKMRSRCSVVFPCVVCCTAPNGKETCRPQCV